MPSIFRKLFFYGVVFPASALTGAGAVWLVLFYFGVLTGVFGICATAPAWWSRVFLYLEPVSSVVSGVASCMIMMRLCREDLRDPSDAA